MIRVFTWLLLAVLVAGCQEQTDSTTEIAVPEVAEPALAEETRPNFLVIITDDMGYTDLGAFGGDDIRTPNLDELAFNGVRLTNFHSAPSCQPARAMLMSGNGNHEGGIGSQTVYPEHEGQWGYEYHLPERIAALPEVLQEAGYNTFMSGKWHLADGDEHLPGLRGFDRAFALLEGADGHIVSAFETELAYSQDGVRTHKPEGHSTDLFVDRMIQFMEENQTDSTPFFAYFAPTAPHWPIQAHPDWMDTYAGAYDEGFDVLCGARMTRAAELGVLPENADTENCDKREAPWTELDEETQLAYSRRMEIYAGMTEHLDQRFGDLIAYMDERGLMDNTWVIYMNDNGPQGGSGGARTVGDLTGAEVDSSYEAIGTTQSWGNHGLGWADATSSPFRNGKSWQYEGGIRVPAFAWHADQATSGTIDDERLFVMDIMPTLLDLSATPAPGPEFRGREVIAMRGKSFAPVLAGEDVTVHDRDTPIVFRRVVYLRDYKLVKHNKEDWELYNIEQDPGEKNNLFNEMPDVAAELIAAYEAQSEISNYIPLVPVEAPAGAMGGAMGGS